MIASVAVSGLGTWGYNVGVAVYAYQRTHSAGWVAAVTVGRYVPALLLSWLAGSFLDRLPRRPLAVRADLVCCVVMVALAGLGSAGAPVWLIALVAAVSSASARIQAAAVLALAADVVVESQLMRASLLAGSAEAVATAAGAAVASVVLVHFTPPTLFLVNAASFAVSAALIAKVRSARPAPDERTRTSVRQQLVRAPRTRVFWPLQSSRAVVACVYGLDVVLLAEVASRRFHSGPSGYGWLLAAAGFGGLLAAAPARRAVGRFTAAVVCGGLLLYALPLALFATDLPVPVIIGLQVVRGVGSVLASSSVLSALQRAVPSAMAGRAFGLTQSLVLAGTSLGAVIAPLLLDVTGYRATLLIAAVAPILLQAVMLPGLVRFDRRHVDLLTALEPRLAILRGLQLLRDASRATLYEIADGSEDLTVQPGAVIVREGEQADAFYVLVAGSLEATGVRDGQPVHLRTMTAPDYFGEIGLIHQVPRTATVTAVGATQLWRVPAAVFLGAVSDAGVSGALTDTVHLRLRTSDSATGRIANTRILR